MMIKNATGKTYGIAEKILDKWLLTGTLSDRKIRGKTNPNIPTKNALLMYITRIVEFLLP